MKRAPIRLIYHSMHARPMPGCLPLFVLLSAILVGLIMATVHVVLPRVEPPKGVGRVLYKNDELTRFRVRQHSALPLRLPDSIDPLTQLPIPKHKLPLERKVRLQPAPPADPDSSVPDSVVLDPQKLLRLPSPSTEQQPQPPES